MKDTLKELLKITSCSTDVIVTGFEDSGKATFVEALARSFNVQKFLQIRENLQNVNTHVIASNSDMLDENKLYILAKFRKQTAEDFDEDKTFESVIYAAIKDFVSNQDIKDYQEKLIENLRQEFFSKKPHSFYYRLGMIDNDIFTKLIHILFEIDVNRLLNFWNSATEEERNNVETFAISLHDYVQHINNLCTIRREFYTLAAKCSNHNITKCINRFENAFGACVREIQPGYFQLVVSINPDPNNRLELELLLNDWAGSCWNLFYDITLIFKGNSVILGEHENLHFFVTANLESLEDGDNKPLTKLTINTKCNNIIFLVDSTRAQKDLDKLIEITCNINLSIIFTNFDRCILNFASQHTSHSKFDNPYNTDWIDVENGYNYADFVLCDFIKQFKNDLQKINLVSTSKAMLNTLGTDDDFISECTYPKAIKSSVDAFNGITMETTNGSEKLKFLDAF